MHGHYRGRDAIIFSPLFIHPHTKFGYCNVFDIICFVLLKLLCFRPGTVLKTALESWSCFTSMSMSFKHECLEWLIDEFFIPLTIPELLNTVTVGSMRFSLQVRFAASSVIFAPSPAMQFLASRFKCSRWRSQEIFFPGLPRTFN